MEGCKGTLGSVCRGVRCSNALQGKAEKKGRWVINMITSCTRTCCGRGARSLQGGAHRRHRPRRATAACGAAPARPAPRLNAPHAAARPPPSLVQTAATAAPCAPSLAPLQKVYVMIFGMLTANVHAAAADMWCRMLAQGLSHPDSATAPSWAPTLALLQIVCINPHGYHWVCGMGE